MTPRSGDDTSFLLFTLAGAGSRRTRQRARILRAILSMDGHFTVRDLLDALAREGEAVSRPTVYRCVKLLANCGILTPVGYSEGTRQFELSRTDERHAHLACISCGAVTEVHSGEIEAAALAEARKGGVLPLDFTFEIRGLCPSCRRNSEGG